MGHYITHIVLMVVFCCHVWSYPLGTGRENSSMCNYKGNLHEDGETISVDEPCLLCRCRKGALTCSLKICPDVPDPPPPGCYIVHNTNQCCPAVLCQTEEKETDIEIRTVSGSQSNIDEVCIINGSLYAEGSALESSDQCEYCYCIKGLQKCIKPKCVMPFEGCKPIYSQKSCCPTQYDCRDRKSNITKTHEENSGCYIDGVRYSEGEMLLSNNSNCENCYCMNGQIKCAPVTCETEFKGECEPVFRPGQCCPTSYICSKPIMGNSIRSLSKRLNRKDAKNNAEDGLETTTESVPNTTEPITTTEEDALTETTTEFDDVVKIRTDDSVNATESSLQKNATIEITTIETEESTSALSTSPYLKNKIIDIFSRNHVNLLNENKTVLYEESSTSLPSLDEIYSSSSQTDDEYDTYDYSEPKLPPSLPNLIIFPFVAADAVVKDEETTKSISYDESSIKRVGTETSFYKDYFSPPTKTEGGFIPKQPPVLANSYQANSYPEKDGSYLSAPPTIIIPPKPNTDQCVFKGLVYEHGELLSEPGECQSCICYYGEVICREVICPEVRQGCRRTLEKDVKSCCGKVVCDTKEPDNPVEIEFLLTTEKPKKQTKPSATIADVIEVTPNPFKDVIRTETAPDLSSLTGELFDQQTKKPVTVTYKNLIVHYYPDYLVTTTRDDLRRKNYKNTPFYPTEIYPFTEKPSVNVTQSVTSSVSASDDLEGNNSKYPYELIRTSIRPVITMATEPSRLFDYYTVEEYRATPKQELRRTRPANRKKTTESPNETKTAGVSKHKTKTKTKQTTVKPPDKSAADDSFSLDSVLRFFFNTETTTATPTTRRTTSKDAVKKSTAGLGEERSKLTTKPVPEFRYKESVGSSSTPKSSDLNKKKNAIGGLLKLAGCNIYGRMYRVGKIIAELSNPCLECICTDIGVECNPLIC